MNDTRLPLKDDFEPPARLEANVRSDLARALAHPRLAALAPVANGALAVGLGVYALAYLVAIFSVVFAR